MRELTLLDTGYLCGLLLLSLVLPVLLSLRGPLQTAAARKSGLRIVSLGQMCVALAAAGVLASAEWAPYAAALGVVSCLAWALVLQRQLAVV